MENYTRQSNLVTDIIAEQAPVLEKASIDEFYLDVSGMDRFFDTFKWTQELSDTIRSNSGLPLSFGLSVNKTVAKMATSESKPLGQLYIDASSVRPFLNPLSIIKIPMLGNSTYQTLCRIGIKKIHTLADMPVEFLTELLGKNGISLWKKANGKDNTPVQPYHESKSVSSERTFMQDTMNIKELRAVLIRLVENVGYQLRKESKLTSTITVKIRYTNFDTHTKQLHIPYTSSDQVLIQKAIQLFEGLYERRMMLRLVGVRLSRLVRGNYQISLFDDNEHLINLYQAMDRLKGRFGSNILVRGSNVKPPKNREDVP